MTPAQTLNHLAAEGFQLKAKGDKLEVTGDLSRLTPQLREKIHLNRRGVLQLLEFRDERIAIQQEHLSSPGDLEWPTFEDVKNRRLPPGFAIKQWLPAAPAVKQYAETLETAGVEVHRVDGNCCCGSTQAVLQHIHDGDSLRQDCAKCGRFQHFVVWGDAREVDRVLALLSNKRDAAEVGPSTTSLTTTFD